MNVLVTGGAGYIGSHTVKMLLDRGHQVTVIDNLSRGHLKAVPEGVRFENIDLLDYDKLVKTLPGMSVDAVVHFAAFAYVGESVENPGLYYTNNVTGSINLIKAVKESGIKKFVFSSTCSLYGNPLTVPISESEPVKPINPYAKTKMMIEQVLADYNEAFGLKYVALRYFNAAGCDMNGEIGESHEPETHLIPLVLFTALGKRENISVFGDDYPTADGTCVRDYIHVYDLADAHLRALDYLDRNESTVVNLGTGNGYSVQEIIDKAEEITGKKIKRVISPRRAGDPAVLIADNRKAFEVLGWKPRYDLADIIKSAWAWHQNPKY
ncbi:MAG: UDP-glucose 4-epimerase GalE [Syntrophothermus sp.]